MDHLGLAAVGHMLLVMVDAPVGEIHGPVQREMVSQYAFFVHLIFPENVNPVRM